MVSNSSSGEIQFYDSNTGKLLFTAPRGRSLEDFFVESRAHGWPSFRGAYLSNRAGFSHGVSVISTLLNCLCFLCGQKQTTR